MEKCADDDGNSDLRDERARKVGTQGERLKGE